MKKENPKRFVKSYINKKGGATAIEFAILVPVFLLLLVAILEIGLQSLVQSELDGLAYNFTLSMAITEDSGMSKEEILNLTICSEPTVLVHCEKVETGIDAFDRHTFAFLSRSRIECQ